MSIVYSFLADDGFANAHSDMGTKTIRVWHHRRRAVFKKDRYGSADDTAEVKLLYGPAVPTAAVSKALRFGYGEVVDPTHPGVISPYFSLTENELVVWPGAGQFFSPSGAGQRFRGYPFGTGYDHLCVDLFKFEEIETSAIKPYGGWRAVVPEVGDFPVNAWVQDQASSNDVFHKAGGSATFGIATRADTGLRAALPCAGGYARLHVLNPADSIERHTDLSQTAAVEFMGSLSRFINQVHSAHRIQVIQEASAAQLQARSIINRVLKGVS